MIAGLDAAGGSRDAGRETGRFLMANPRGLRIGAPPVARTRPCPGARSAPGPLSRPAKGATMGERGWPAIGPGDRRRWSRGPERPRVTSGDGRRGGPSASRPRIARGGVRAGTRGPGTTGDEGAPEQRRAHMVRRSRPGARGNPLAGLRRVPGCDRPPPGAAAERDRPCAQAERRWRKRSIAARDQASGIGGRAST